MKILILLQNGQNFNNNRCIRSIKERKKKETKKILSILHDFIIKEAFFFLN